MWLLLSRNAELQGDIDGAGRFMQPKRHFVYLKLTLLLSALRSCVLLPNVVLALRQCAPESFAGDHRKLLAAASSTTSTYSIVTSLTWEKLAHACKGARLFLFATDAYDCAMSTTASLRPRDA